MHPRYAGAGDQRQTTIDSMAKLAVFVAAFILRDQVRAAATRLKDEKKEKVLKRIASAWKPFWETRFPDRPADSPKIEKVFSINLGGPEHWQIRFDWDPKGEDELHGLAHSSAAEKVSYRDRLELMMRWSSNEAATGCIDGLGFQALNSLLEDAGFFDVRKGGGLWVSRAYAPDSSWGRRDPAGGGTNQGGTARAVAEVLTLMAQDRLVRAGVAAEMRRFMSRDGAAHGYGSWIVNAITAADEPGTPSGGTPVKRRVGSWVAKVGLFTKLADCAVLERITADDRTLRYIAVVLNCPDEDTLNKVSVKLDDCILAMHPAPL
jgi:Beta-lactamase enzyme family